MLTVFFRRTYGLKRFFNMYNPDSCSMIKRNSKFNFHKKGFCYWQQMTKMIMVTCNYNFLSLLLLLLLLLITTRKSNLSSSTKEVVAAHTFPSQFRATLIGMMKRCYVVGFAVNFYPIGCFQQKSNSDLNFNLFQY